MTTFWQAVLNGLGLGSMYLLVSIGLVLVFSVLKIVNFAHGELLMVASYLVFIGYVLLNGGVAGTAAITIGGMLVVGLVLYAVVVNPALKRPSINQLVATFGTAVLLQNLVQLVVGSENRSIPVSHPTVNIFGATIYAPTLIGIAVAVCCIVLVHAVVRWTEFGIILRAVAQDPVAAAATGIRSQYVAGTVFVAATMLAGIGGLFLALTYPISPHVGAEFTLKAFTVAVLAGMGNIAAAGLISLLLGVGESLVGVYVGTRAINILAYGILVVVLITRPTGLFRGEDA